MSLSKLIITKKAAAFFGFAIVVAAIIVFNGVFAAGGPVMHNPNPQGKVTSSDVKLSLDTEDLARCKYGTEDVSYSDMGEKMTSPDGLYHFVELGTLSEGSYTYYARCKDYEGNETKSSVEMEFNIGEVTTPPDPDKTPRDTVAPLLSGLLPSGTIYDQYASLSVNTNEAADCRYSWYDKSFDSMTLLFSTTDRLYHTKTAPLTANGYYNYYVRCRDDAGNVNALAGRISFRYGDPVVYTPPVQPSDTTEPNISNLAPYGEINNATATISCDTDEAATCKYGASDDDYDTLADVFDDDSGKTSHSKEIVLPAEGSYTYYVRCKDKAGNKNTASSNIEFNYVAPVKDGPVISNLQPSGTIYQENVALIVQTDKAADCRYSLEDVDFDDMQDSFSTNDGLLQQATVTLAEYGSYSYYVRCSDKEGNKDAASEIINFEYQNPNPDDEGPVTEPETATTTTECVSPTTADKDGVCEQDSNCICDPDCPPSGEKADPDCANVVVSNPNTGWVVLLFIGLLFVVIVVIIIVVIKRRSNEEEVELP